MSSVAIVAGFFAATCFAAKAVLVRLAYREGMDASGMLGLRMLLCLPIVLFLAWWFGRKAPALSLRQRVALLGLGMLGYHLASWLDFTGLQYIDAALERVVLSLYPLVVVGWAIYRGRRGINARLLVALTATIGGIVLTFGDSIHLGGDHQTLIVGVILVAASACCFASYLINAEILVARIGGLRAMAWGLSGASVSVTIHALSAHGLPLFAQTPRVWAYAAMMALGSTIIPVLLMGWVVERLGASRAAILGLAGPALTALLAWALLGEHLGLSGWLGLTITTVGAAAVGGKPPPVPREIPVLALGPPAGGLHPAAALPEGSAPIIHPR